MIYPLEESRPNLHVVTGIQVKHVTFDEYVSVGRASYGRLIKTLTTSKNRATGVTFAPNPLFHPDGPTETRTVRGTKLIVLSSGALGTPGILERSGIGREGVLDAVGVKQRVDLPGVGENYHGSLTDSYGDLSMLLTIRLA